MFNKILIANRGEIAVRIIRACRNLGIRSVAVYSKEDAKSLHVQLADQRICIGEGPARNSYLNMDRIIAAAENMGADAIHPGFGFLSENSEFVRKCKENGITFIGPDADVIDKMGNKSQARKTMMEAGVMLSREQKNRCMMPRQEKNWRMILGIRLLSRHLRVVAEKECVLPTTRKNLNFSSIWHRENLQMLLATIPCISSVL